MDDEHFHFTQFAGHTHLGRSAVYVLAGDVPAIVTMCYNDLAYAGRLVKVFAFRQGDRW
jgi:hypothetical protein